MTAPIRQCLMTLLEEYQDVFAWSYQDMPGLDSDIMQHKLPLNPGSSPVKQKLRRMRPEMSLKIKEEVRKQFDAGFLAVARTQSGWPTLSQSRKRTARFECV